MSATGAAIMANDPHLGIRLPNIWLLAGVKSPSYHAVGLMVPGIPFIAIGRNPWIAWGGTNMRAASSALFDAEDAAMTTRRERIGVRWWFDREVEIRETRWGPVLSDAPQLAAAVAASGSGPFALSWTGHLPSDEIGAMLKVNRARSFAEFREALSGFAVPGQNMLYADNDGNIGQVMAVRLPGLGDAAPADLVLPPDGHAERWAGMRGHPGPALQPQPRSGVPGVGQQPADRGGGVGSATSSLSTTVSCAWPNCCAAAASASTTSRPCSGTSTRPRRRRCATCSWRGSTHRASPGALARTGSARARGDARMGRALQPGLARRALAYEAFREAFVRSFYAARLGERDGDAFADAGRIERMMAADIEGAPARPELDAAMGTALNGRRCGGGEVPGLGRHAPARPSTIRCPGCPSSAGASVSPMCRSAAPTTR